MSRAGQGARGRAARPMAPGHGEDGSTCPGSMCSGRAGESGHLPLSPFPALLALLALSTTLQAEPPPGPDAALERIEVIGSRIKRVEVETARWAGNWARGALRPAPATTPRSTSPA